MALEILQLKIKANLNTSQQPVQASAQEPSGQGDIKRVSKVEERMTQRHITGSDHRNR